MPSSHPWSNLTALCAGIAAGLLSLLGAFCVFRLFADMPEFYPGSLTSVFRPWYRPRNCLLALLFSAQSFLLFTTFVAHLCELFRPSDHA